MLTLDCAWVYSCETKLDYRQRQRRTDKDHEHSTSGAKGWSTRIYGEALCRRAAFAGAVCFKLLTKPFSKSAFLFHFQGRCRRCVESLQCLKILKHFKLEVSLYTGLGDKKLQLPFNEVQPLSMSCFDIMLADSPDISWYYQSEFGWEDVRCVFLMRAHQVAHLEESTCRYVSIIKLLQTCNRLPYAGFDFCMPWWRDAYGQTAVEKTTAASCQHLRSVSHLSDLELVTMRFALAPRLVKQLNSSQKPRPTSFLSCNCSVNLLLHMDPYGTYHNSFEAGGQFERLETGLKMIVMTISLT